MLIIHDPHDESDFQHDSGNDMAAPSQIEMPLAAQSYPSDPEEAGSIAPVWSSRLLLLRHAMRAAP